MKDNQAIQKYYHTSNISVVAWLLSGGIESVKKENINGRFVFFFNDTEMVKNRVNEYYENTQLRIFLQNLRAVKNEIGQQS
jgi:hypothetical protein